MRATVAGDPPHTQLRSDSFLEYAFLRWVLAPATDPAISGRVIPQRPVEVHGRCYRLDYELAGDELLLAIELDGYEFHSSRDVFTYDRLRQNDLHATGRVVIRFSYDAIRADTARCVAQLQAVLARDRGLAAMIVPDPVIETPDMNPDALFGLSPSPVVISASEGAPAERDAYFDDVRGRLNQRTLRDCQTQAFAALANYYTGGERNAACVMSVGAGKTALGVAAILGFTRRRALIVTPGSVIRGTFDRALDHTANGNVLYGLPGGPLIPGTPPPHVRVLEAADGGAIRDISRAELLAADMLVTNFHALGHSDGPSDLLAKLGSDDIDFIVVDEAHIAAAESYQRLFAHFPRARTLLMSACFQRLDGRPIDADVVYRYRLIDSIADGNAKNLRLHRFAPACGHTTYEMVWPDGAREEIVGRQALLEVLGDERKLSRITARSTEPMRHVLSNAKHALNEQARLLNPVKPRMLISAMGEAHAEQIVAVCRQVGIAAAYLYYTMSTGRIRDIRNRFESDAGDLEAIVQIKMLGQGYDFPAICVVVPMRPYGSFSECYQFLGRGIRVIQHPALTGRVAAGEQCLDIVYHAELGIDEHVATIYAENDMDPSTAHVMTQPWTDERGELAGVIGHETADRPDTFVLFERGAIVKQIVHDTDRVEQARLERDRQALAHRYSEYVRATQDPVTFEQYAVIMASLTR